ncbi:MAG: hypothetical protein GY870_04995 [archaeon]|nr:hypothetical protein [archaeon]
MLKITKNTYPENRIGTYKIGTLCLWVKTINGHLNLRKCDKNGKLLPEILVRHEDGYSFDENLIFGHGQIYAKNGNLLSGKKEPVKVGLIAKFVKKGWFLEVSNCCHKINY